MWQSKLIGIGQAVLIVSLVPTVVGGYVVSPLTGVVNSTILCSFGYAFHTENKTLATWTSALSSVMWGVLAWRSIWGGI